MVQVIFNIPLAIDGIKKDVQERIERALQSSVLQIQADLRRIIRDGFLASPEYKDLLPGGDLYGELGVLFADNAVLEIVDSLAANTNFTVSKNRLRVEVFKGDYSSLISLPAASFISEKGGRVDWLEWLLLRGTDVVVANYAFVAGDFTSSRTGQGLMFQIRSEGTIVGSSKIRGGLFQGVTFDQFRIASEFAGTANNNWVTRVLVSVEPQIVALIQRTIEQNL